MNLPAGQVSAWGVIIPVKRLSAAKTRLGGARPELALAFAIDVMAAARGSALVHRIIVVTDDPEVEAAALRLGCEVVADPGAGLNAALAAGRLSLGSELASAMVAADLPCLTTPALDAVLQCAAAALASGAEAAALADAPGTGTAMLACPPGSAFPPAFGPRSFARHTAAGAAPIEDPADSMHRARRDVDTEVDLWDARRIGVGPATAEILG